jgi:hypothetical protein
MKRNHSSSPISKSKNTIHGDTKINDFEVETILEILFYMNTNKHIKEDLVDLCDQVNA